MATNQVDLPAVNAVVQEAMERLQVPGVALGVLHNDQEYIAGFGVTNVDHPLPIDGDTLFQIGSTSKTVTGTAVMRLVEKGSLDLDAPVRSYLPGLRLVSEEAAARVTLRHLLTHTAGWVGDYFDDFGPGDDALERMVSAMADLPQPVPLGELWSYNNSAFYLAGRVIEVVTGQTFEAAVQELVLEPLGMTRSFFFASDAITHRVAVGHRGRDGRIEVVRPWALPRTAHPAGGIISTAGDQLRYARFHLGDGTAVDGTRILSSESMARMQAPQVAAELDDAWGLTWGLQFFAGERIVRHGGATNGQMSAFLMVPGRRFAVTVLTNADLGRLLHEEVTRWLLTHYLGLEEHEPTPRVMSEQDLLGYVGRYTGALNDFELVLRDGGLALLTTFKGGFPLKTSPPLPSPPPARLAFIGDDRCIVLDGPMKGRRGEFLRDNEGRIVWLRSSRLYARQH